MSHMTQEKLDAQDKAFTKAAESVSEFLKRKIAYEKRKKDAEKLLFKYETKNADKKRT